MKTTLISEKSPQYKWWLLANIMLGTFLAIMDTTIVNVGLPVIMREMGHGIGEAQWVATGYMLSMIIMLPTAGYLAQRYGYKRIYMLGLVIFTIGSLMCSTSHSLIELIAWRIFQGFGCGMIQPLGMAIISREFPPRQRGLALGFWAVAVAASVSVGPFVGGYLVDNFSWHSIFVVNVPLGILAIVGTILIQHEYREKEVGKFDIIGFVLMVMWLPTSLFTFSQLSAADNTQGWLSPMVLVSAGVTVLFFLLFVWYSLRSAKPLVNLRLFKYRDFSVGILIMSLFGVGLFGGNFLLPLYLQHVLGYSAMAAGLVFLPVGLIQGTLAPLSGMLGRHTGNKVLVVAGLVLLVSYFLLSSTFYDHTPEWVIMLSLYLRGLGMGLSFTPLNTIIVNSVPQDQITQAAGISNTLRQTAGSIGIAALTWILTMTAAGGSTPIQPEHEQQMRNTVSTYALQGVEVSSDVDHEFDELMQTHRLDQSAYIRGIQNDFALATFLTALGIIPLFWLRENNKIK